MKIEKEVVVEFDISFRRRVIVYLATPCPDNSIDLPSDLPEKGLIGFKFPSFEIVTKDKEI